MNMPNLIGREKELFKEDISNYNQELQNIISSSKFLVIGLDSFIKRRLLNEKI